MWLLDLGGFRVWGFGLGFSAEGKNIKARLVKAACFSAEGKNIKARLVKAACFSASPTVVTKILILH
jgi:hypothetical protein